ncbi:thiamine-phosphate kinase [Pelagicoccus albus]|uniref:Thiamine-monophosphate kinase n=1 Tax=Pelagicoccus albus TaxID=415222 RepID=A0A7X1B2X2_9BACT|nr:thiamine-phosphate kinase [Pelagicoccus albus]MBC2604679.1 thiamine-monophosphate kinase [Pelagicoccus albus]
MKLWLGSAAPQAPEGMGDDCSVLKAPQAKVSQLVTADPVIYGQHFNDALSPEQAAAKLLRRNLSDIAAMGGKPTHAVICLALDPSISVSWIQRFYIQLGQEALANEVRIVGGDVSTADNFLGAFLTLYGETLPDTKPLLRQTSQDGSPVFVTGSLGGTIFKKHFDFTPRLAEGQWLAKSGLCLSCSDLSDGLGKDYANITPTGGTCEIDCSLLPISRDAQTMAEKSGKGPLYHAFNDGEDFELIFALHPDTDLAVFLSDWKDEFKTRVSHIGYIRQNSGTETTRLTLLNTTKDFAASGYEHLR